MYEENNTFTRILSLVNLNHLVNQEICIYNKYSKPNKADDRAYLYPKEALQYNSRPVLTNYFYNSYENFKWNLTFKNKKYYFESCSEKGEFLFVDSSQNATNIQVNIFNTMYLSNGTGWYLEYEKEYIDIRHHKSRGYFYIKNENGGYLHSRMNNVALNNGQSSKNMTVFVRDKPIKQERGQWIISKC